MLLGNKCDIEAKRKVSKEVGEKVRDCFQYFFKMIFQHKQFVREFALLDLDDEVTSVLQ